MQVARWGDSLAVRIPADVARSLGIKEGGDVTLRALEQGELAVITEQARREVALARLRSLRGSAPARFKFDREEANAR